MPTSNERKMLSSNEALKELKNITSVKLIYSVGLQPHAHIISWTFVVYKYVKRMVGLCIFSPHEH